MTEPIEIRSESAAMVIYDDKVTITRHGLGGLFSFGPWRGTQEIQIASITGIAWRDAGRLKEGYLQFVTAGGIDQRDPYHDARSVVFARRSQPLWERAKELIEERRARLTAGMPSAPDAGDQLRKLAELRDAGVVTADEFQAKKRELLARM